MAFDKLKLKLGEKLIGNVKYTDTVIKHVVRNHTEEIRDIVTDVVLKMEESEEKKTHDNPFVVRRKVVVSDNVFNVDLKDLVRMVYYDRLTIGQVPVLEFKENKLFYMYCADAKNVFETDLIIWDIVLEAYYSDVPEFRKFVYYDDIMNILEYTNNVEDKATMSSSTCIIPVLNNHDLMIKEVLKKIKN